MKLSRRSVRRIAAYLSVLLGSVGLQARLSSRQPGQDAGVPPKFEVASIKPNNSGSQGTFFRRFPGGLYRAENVQLRVLIASAYLHGFPPNSQLVFGGPHWIDKQRFDIEARAEGNPNGEQVRSMERSLLEDRFKLVLHHEIRQLPVYALLVATPGKTGRQLIPHSDTAKCSDPLDGRLSQPKPGEPLPAYCGGLFMNPQPGDLRESGNKITIDMLVAFLDQSVDRKVVNQTGLKGVFDFTLEFAPEVGPGSQALGTADVPDSSPAPSLFTALKEQLGLKLKSTKGPVDVVVIDHVEEPSAN
ncbi:MAG: TIGR03435 family protein [Candidatus Sulfotelmatobacter sp.]